MFNRIVVLQLLPLHAEETAKEGVLRLALTQSLAMPSEATPVILPAAPKPNNRLVASPKREYEFHYVERLRFDLAGLHNFGAQR